MNFDGAVGLSLLRPGPLSFTSLVNKLLPESWDDAAATELIDLVCVVEARCPLLESKTCIAFSLCCLQEVQEQGTN